MTTESYLEPKNNLLRKYPLVSFFVLCYIFFLITILIIGAVVSLTSVSDIVMGLLIACASWTPNLAAVVVTSVTGGKARGKAFIRGLAEVAGEFLVVSGRSCSHCHCFWFSGDVLTLWRYCTRR